jgi:hypothetical protein
MSICSPHCVCMLSLSKRVWTSDSFVLHLQECHERVSGVSYENATKMVVQKFFQHWKHFLCPGSIQCGKHSKYRECGKHSKYRLCRKHSKYREYGEYSEHWLFRLHSRNWSARRISRHEIELDASSKVKNLFIREWSEC